MSDARLRLTMVDPGAFSPFYDDALCRALAQESCAVDLVTAPFAYHAWPRAEGYRRRELFPPARTVRRNGFAAIDRARHQLARIGRGLAYVAAWRSFEATLEEHRPGIIHLQWSLVPIWEQFRFSRGAPGRTPLVVTVHNARPRSDDPCPLGGGGRLLRRARAVVVHSESTRAAVVALHPDLAARIVVIPPGIAGLSDRRLAGGDGRRFARRVLGLEEGAPLALFAGLVRESKGLATLLAAFREVAARLPGAILAVAGLPKPAWVDLAARVERAGLGGRVRLELEYLPAERFELYLAASDVVVLPYLEASDSAVLGSALGASRAVIASRVGGLPEMLGDRYPPDLLVEPGDPAALASALVRLLENRTEAARIGCEAGADAARRYSWQRTARATADLYRELSFSHDNRVFPSLATSPV